MLGPRPSFCDLMSTTKPLSYFEEIRYVGFLQKLSSKLEICEIISWEYTF
jgi:hypothetical protein